MRAGRSRRADRPERRRQDHLRQSRHRSICSRIPARCCSAARISPRFGPIRRVRQGLVRSFQVTRLFPNDAAGASRAGDPAARGQSRPRCSAISRRMPDVMAEVERAACALLGLGRLADRKVREIAYGQQRLLEIALGAGAASRRCCCSTSRRPVCRKATRRASSAALDRLPPDLAVLMIEHDMDLVFRFARRVSCWPPAAHLRRLARRMSRAITRCAKPIWGAMPMPAAPLDVADLSAGYGPTRVIEDISFSVPAGARLAMLGRNGMGKTTLLATLAGQTTRSWRRDHARRAPISRHANLSARLQRARLRAAGALHLSLADGRGKSVRRA